MWASQRVGFGRPPGGEMDQSDIGRPKGSMNEAARWRTAVGEYSGFKAGWIWTAAWRRDGSVKHWAPQGPNERSRPAAKGAW